MDEKRVLEFIQVILQSSTSNGPLEQLEKILSSHGNQEMAQLVRQAREDSQEVREQLAGSLTREDLEVAHRRAEERRRREWEQARYGRC